MVTPFLLTPQLFTRENGAEAYASDPTLEPLTMGQHSTGSKAAPNSVHVASGLCLILLSFPERTPRTAWLPSSNQIERTRPEFSSTTKPSNGFA